jgi:hypothetical protein
MTYATAIQALMVYTCSAFHEALRLNKRGNIPRFIKDKIIVEFFGRAA